MNSTILILLIVALAIYLVVRQFTEQQVTWRTLLLLPVLAAYGSYTELQADFSRFAPALLIASIAIGVLPGLLTGIYRGKHTHVRMDSASGIVRSKPELASSLTWLGLLLVHIAVIALSYTILTHGLLGAMLTAFAGSLVLFNIVAQKFMVYQQYSRYQTSVIPQQFNSTRN